MIPPEWALALFEIYDELCFDGRLTAAGVTLEFATMPGEWGKYQPDQKTITVDGTAQNVGQVVLHEMAHAKIDTVDGIRSRPPGHTRRFYQELDRARHLHHQVGTQGQG